MLSKTQLIELIQQFNRSARREWLDLFDTIALRRYLEHLQWSFQPRGRDSFWIRQGETPAALTRQPQD
jgi:hypothetical protein